MIDFHTHTLLSDGQLIPSEMVRRAVVAGYTVIGLTDHVDDSNIDFVLPRIVRISKILNSFWDIAVIPGVEVTHAPLQHIPKLVRFARKNGAKVVIVHGETPGEPVIPGTNRIGIESGATILAHPGYITAKDALLASKRNVYLELTARRMHKKTNSHVVKMAGETGAKLVLNTDAHSDTDFITDRKAKQILTSLRLSPRRAEEVLNNSRILANSLLHKK